MPRLSVRSARCPASSPTPDRVPVSIALRDAVVMGMLRGAHGDAARALAHAEDQAALDPSAEGQAFWQDIIPYLRLLAATRRGGMRAESPRAPAAHRPSASPQVRGHPESLALMSILRVQRPTTSQCRAAAEHFHAQRPDCSHVYVAAIRQVDGRFDLEVEVDAGTIAYVLPAGTARLCVARHEAKKFAKALSAIGVTVFATRTAWDAHLEAVDAADSADPEVAA